eukprot:CAMPEP_0178525922 /NCGR_PEP_ID=MMETSP0696-20121128/30446_1 /TAXON_ID=265572 /ORGANISM="Extubocellulus spinifer, Strain CCMP396" /LENGTH=50 /DNA_ID=CAMNT_0020157379 /DNA_START=51 /DNA_END=199 /DNA_ORIENTATION=+
MQELLESDSAAAPIVGWEIAIIDGTHLCLLPPVERRLPSPSVDGGKKIVP